MQEASNPNKHIAEDEIDLLAILDYLLTVFKRHFLWLFIAVALGAALGSFGYFAFRGVYTSKAIFQSRNLSNPELIEITNSLDELIYEKSYDLVAKQLNISVEEAVNIKSLKSLELSDESFRKESKDSLFAVEAKVYNADLLPKLSKALFYYYNENQFIKSFNQAYIKSQQDLLNNIQSELKTMQALKAQLLTDEASNQKAFLGDLYEATLELLEKEAEIKQQLSFKEDVQVVQSFTQYRSVSSFNLPKSLIAGAAAGLGLWILLVVAQELSRALRRYRQENPSR